MVVVDSHQAPGETSSRPCGTLGGLDPKTVECDISWNYINHVQGMRLEQTEHVLKCVV